MAITVEGPGGVTIEFPDGTDPTVIKGVMQRQFSGTQPADPQRQIGTGEAFGRGALQGATFNTSDELAGIYEGVGASTPEIASLAGEAFRAPMSAVGTLFGYGGTDFTGKADAVVNKFVPAYEKGVGEVRAANDLAYEQNPYAYLGGNVAGGIASTAIPVVGQMGRTAQGANLAARTYTGAKTGAVLGGLAGAGASRGGAMERLEGGATGAVAGSALGGTLPAILTGGGAVANAIGSRVQAARDPVSRGQSLVAQALADDIAPDATAAQAGVRIGRKMLQAQGPADIRRASSSPAVGDASLRLMDVGGENTRNLLRSAANQKSPAGNTLNKHLDARQVSQNLRVERGVKDLVRRTDQVAGKTSIFGGRGIQELVDFEPERIVDELISESRSKGGPLFQQAFSAKIPVTQELIDVLDRPGIKRLAELAQETARNEGKDLSTVSPIELLHRIKMQIDRQIGSVKRGIQDSKANWDVRTLVRMKKDLVNAIGVPEYKKALKAYAGPAAVRNAFEDGMSDGLSATPHAIRIARHSMSQDESFAYRYGVARALIQKSRAAKVNSDRTKGLFGTPDAMARARAISTSRTEFREFQRMLVKEAKMSATRAAVQGNSTTAKQLTQLNEGANAASGVRAAGNAVLGRLGPLLDVAGRAVARLGGMTPEVANEVIKAAMATTGTQNQIALQKAIARARASNAGQDELARVLLRIGVQVMNSSTERRGGN